MRRSSRERCGRREMLERKKRARLHGKWEGKMIQPERKEG